MLLADLTDFIDRDRPHGTLAGDATEPTELGYLLTVQCECSVAVMRWVTGADAVCDLVRH